MLGLTPSPNGTPAPSESGNVPDNTPEGAVQNPSELVAGSKSALSAKLARLGGATPKVHGLANLKTFHKGKDRRPFHVTHWQPPSNVPLTAAILFYSDQDSDPIEGMLKINADGHTSLTVDTRRNTTAGTWRGVVCGQENEQIGFIDIEL
jgi:hypothetical protein